MASISDCEPQASSSKSIHYNPDASEETLREMERDIETECLTRRVHLCLFFSNSPEVLQMTQWGTIPITSFDPDIWPEIHGAYSSPARDNDPVLLFSPWKPFERTADLSFAINVVSLHLFECAGTVNMGGDMPRLESFSMLKYQHILDMTPFSRARDVSLLECRGITDVAPLCGCECVKLSGCHSIVDVSALADVRDLSIVNCDSIVEVGAMRNETIAICNCKNFIDASGLCGAQSVTLDNLMALENVDPLVDVPHLTVMLCPRVILRPLEARSQLTFSRSSMGGFNPVYNATSNEEVRHYMR